MRPPSRANRVAFRRAVWASVALHLAAAGALFLLLRPTEPKPLQAAIDTRAPHVRMHFTETAITVEVPLQPANTGLGTGATNLGTGATKPPDAPAPPVVTPSSPTLPRGPFAPVPPRTLPAELVALIRKPGTNPTAAPFTDPNVKPAGGGTGSAGASAGAMHGALKPEQTVVYVLDSSGSMGAAGKFEAARRALAATLAQQPPTVRFQVIVYDGTARTLLASDGTAPHATDATVRAATAALAALEPRGKSNHLVAVRAALGFRPDVIVILTDADDLTAAALQPVLKTAAKPVAVCVGLVTADGVRPLRELK